MRAKLAAFLLPCLLCTAPAHALDPAVVARLASDESAARLEAIDAIAASGEEAALTLLQALANGEVQVTAGSRLIIVTDRALDAVTLTPIEPAPDEYEALILNNRMRARIESAIGALSLLSPDRDTRLASARAIESTPEASLLPVLERALNKETDPVIRRSLKHTRAVLDLQSRDPARRLAAVKVLADSNQARVRTMLLQLLDKDADGNLIEPEAEVRYAAQAGLKSVERRLAFSDYFGRIFSGLSLGSILLLVALGLAITYGLLGVINIIQKFTRPPGKFAHINFSAFDCVQVTPIHRAISGIIIWSAQ